ncbi:MAG: glycosyltransferase family 9 protein, partial [bacterium]|nr:glycosyltransferase family 9 protein [bacterium]
MTARRYAYKKKSLIALARLADAVGDRLRRPDRSRPVDPKSILVVRLDQMGDILQTLPVFETLRHSFPNARIGFLTTTQGAEIQSVVPTMADEIFVWNCPWFVKKREPIVSAFKVISWLRSRRFDCALELRGDVRLIAMLRAGGVKNVVGYGATGGGCLLDVEGTWNPEVHAVDRNLALVEAIGGKITTRTPRLPTRPVADPREKRLAIHPDAGTSAKRWPSEFFIETIDRLMGLPDLEIVLIGLNMELGRSITEGINRPAGGRLTNMMGKTSFGELVGLLSDCDGLLSNDSGPAHLMAALGKPIWVLWSGTANASEWCPRGPQV